MVAGSCYGHYWQMAKIPTIRYKVDMHGRSQDCVLSAVFQRCRAIRSQIREALVILSVSEEFAHFYIQRLADLSQREDGRVGLARLDP